MGKWVHRLSDVNPENRTAVCANCGPVGVRSRGSNGWHCSVAHNERKKLSGKRTGGGRGRHGLTRQQARALKDGACCAICGSTENLKVDHDHETMEIRGVLCHGCNVSLGFMKDSPELLRKAADYLEK